MPFLSVQGKTVYYHEGGEFQADRQTLLFIHGAGGTGSKWEHQLTGLKGFNRIALDLPGHGLSGGEAAEEISVYREFVWDFVQAVGLSNFILAGHSMGGAISLDFALTHPDVLAGLIIVDSGARLRVNPQTLEVLSQGNHPLENVKYNYAFNASPEILERAAEEMKAVPTGVYLADFKACDSFNLLGQVQNISLPALVICGLDDQMTPVKFSEYLKKEIANSALVLIPQAGHMAMQEQHELVNQALQDFLSTL